MEVIPLNIGTRNPFKVRIHNCIIGNNINNDQIKGYLVTPYFTVFSLNIKYAFPNIYIFITHLYFRILSRSCCSCRLEGLQWRWKYIPSQVSDQKGQLWWCWRHISVVRALLPHSCRWCGSHKELPPCWPVFPSTVSLTCSSHQWLSPSQGQKALLENREEMYNFPLTATIQFCSIFKKVYFI